MMTNLVSTLVDDLSPVRRVRAVEGIAIFVSITLFCAVIILAWLGPRGDLMAMNPAPMWFLRAGALLLLGIASASAAVAMARPSVGAQSTGWRWALAMAALFPLTALVTAIAHAPVNAEMFVSGYGMFCTEVSMLAAFAIGTGLTLWLRRGAPTSPERAAWLVGIASGSLGGFVFALHCPFNGILYIGVWNTLAVAASALIARAIVPSVLRW